MGTITGLEEHAQGEVEVQARRRTNVLWGTRIIRAQGYRIPVVKHYCREGAPLHYHFPQLRFHITFKAPFLNIFDLYLLLKKREKNKERKTLINNQKKLKITIIKKKKRK